MAVKNTTQVLIGGKIMTLSGYESEEYLQKVAYYINNKMTELGQLPGYSRQSLETKHTLLDLNVADDYFKAKRQAELFEEELETKLNQISEDYDCDIVVDIEESIDGMDPTAYADDFFDYNDYGMGEDKSGILFLITMSERKWCISTHGEAIQIFTDAGQEYMTDNFGSYLSDGEYYEGFMKFADLCEEFIIQAQSGEPYDVENLPEETIPFYMIFLKLQYHMMMLIKNL